MANDPIYTRGTCSALVITCSDFRFKSVERAFIETAGLVDDYDLIARPGAIRSLVTPRTAADRDSMEQEIEMLWKVHGFTRILMLNHMSCRAYDDLATGEGQRDIHLAHLRAARPALESRYADLMAEPHLITIVDGEMRVERCEDG